MRTLGMEMEKAGFIQEMMDDTLKQDDVEAEADEEIDRGNGGVECEILTDKTQSVCRNHRWDRVAQCSQSRSAEGGSTCQATCGP